MNIMATIFDFNGSGRLGRVKIYTKGAVDGQNIHMTKHLMIIWEEELPSMESCQSGNEHIQILISSTVD